MKEALAPDAATHFREPEKWLAGTNAGVASRLIGATADIALVVDQEGVIRDISLGEPSPSHASVRSWMGRQWVETASVESREKIESMLREARTSQVTRYREINHHQDGAPDVSYRYSAVQLGKQGRVLAIGRDLRAIAALQQQLVSAQQAMDREYARLRQAETRYRLLFQVASEGVLIVDTGSHKIAESNPAACALLEDTAAQLNGRVLSTVFRAETWSPLQSMLNTVLVDGRAAEAKAKLTVGSTEVQVSASLFRQGNTSFFLVRLTPADKKGAVTRSERGSRVLEVIEAMPDAWVVIDGSRRVQMVNAAFLELVQLANENQVRGEALDRWLGRPGVDLNILMANLREHGTVRNFATVIRGEYGASHEAVVAGVAAMNGTEPCLGFVIRPANSRVSLIAPGEIQLPRSVEQLKGLVGRVSLKEIVRETTDLIEQLCIEAALEVSADNRASAAQLLGLSRQSLYSKLRRHGLGDLAPEEQS